MEQSEITKSELLKRILKEISQEEWNALEEHPKTLCISAFNRQTLLEARKVSCKEGTAQINRIEELYQVTSDYLNEQMRERPEGHKWILLSCLYLTFLAERPMHPQEIVKYRREENDAGIRYFCPCKDESAGSVCLYCVAEAAINKNRNTTI